MQLFQSLYEKKKTCMHTLLQMCIHRSVRRFGASASTSEITIYASLHSCFFLCVHVLFSSYASILWSIFFLENAIKQECIKQMWFFAPSTIANVAKYNFLQFISTWHLPGILGYQNSSQHYVNVCWSVAFADCAHLPVPITLVCVCVCFYALVYFGIHKNSLHFFRERYNDA